KVLRGLGLGLITGAADDDPSAIGTYASAGAKFGPAFLWMAPATFPMMFAVVYLSSKLGQITGQGLFKIIRNHYPKWILYFSLVGVLIGNTIEAGANMGGMAAAMNLIIPIPLVWIIIPTALAILALQIWGSYRLIRNVLRVLSFSLLAYVGSAILAKPDLISTLKGTFIPTLHFNRESLSMLVAIIGTTLSAYLYTWQSNEEVEEKIATGDQGIANKDITIDETLKMSRLDIFFGMLFSNVVMYFIILSTASTLFKAGEMNIETAAQAAEALRPIAGRGASLLFAAGIVAVGFLAVPIMTTGAAYDFCQTFGWKASLNFRPKDEKKFYIAITVFTFIAMGMNFFGFNPMKALVWSAIVQGFSTPPLMLLIMLMTNNPRIMGNRTNGRAINILGWLTTALTFAASGCLVLTWFL
ncbi:MAG: natural resistance-associated macrophage protein, partial [Bacteriovoracaceae bacterium]|nr:natural resistance-associated macrophage protein [Bacteriovoracaceae bacterium]